MLIVGGTELFYRDGEINSQTLGLRQRDFLRSSNIKTVSMFQVHNRKGQGLSDHILYGPIDETIADEIGTDIFSWARGTCGSNLSVKN